MISGVGGSAAKRIFSPPAPNWLLTVGVLWLDSAPLEHPRGKARTWRLELWSTQLPDRHEKKLMLSFEPTSTAGHPSRWSSPKVLNYRPYSWTPNSKLSRNLETSQPSLCVLLSVSYSVAEQTHQSLVYRVEGAKPTQFALKRTNSGIRRVSAVLRIVFLPPLRAWTGISKL
jgi:hypothetical protein